MKDSFKNFVSAVKNVPSKFKTKSEENSSREIIVFGSLISLLLFFTAFIIFTPFLERDENWIRSLSIIYGFFVLAFALIVVKDFFKKFLQIQKISDLKTYPIYLFLNFWTGLIIPLAIFNEILLKIVRSFDSMPHLGTTLCEIRLSFVDYYYSAHVYWYLHRGLLIVALVTLVYLLVLPVLGKMLSREEK